MGISYEETIGIDENKILSQLVSSFPSNTREFPETNKTQLIEISLQVS